MPLELWSELVVIIMLGGLVVERGMQLVLKRRRPHRQGLVTLCLLLALVIGLSGHAAWRVERHCSSSFPHVDCIPDDYDDLLWRVFVPAKQRFKELRSIVIPW
jgi:hypothetical protein